MRATLGAWTKKRWLGMDAEVVVMVVSALLIRQINAQVLRVFLQDSGQVHRRKLLTGDEMERFGKQRLGVVQMLF
jgi:hypothetical protein